MAENSISPKQFKGIFPIKKIGDSFYILLGKNVRDIIDLTEKSEVLITLQNHDPTYVCPKCGNYTNNLNEQQEGIKDNG